jgi:hypothetical protein
MKLIGNVEVTGLARIVFDKTTVYEFNPMLGSWQREKSPRNGKTMLKGIKHQRMAHNLSCICGTDGYRVRIDGDTANVYSKFVMFESPKKEVQTPEPQKSGVHGSPKKSESPDECGGIIFITASSRR